MLPRLTSKTLSTLALLALGCSSAPPGPAVHMDFTRALGFYDAPFPSDDLRTPSGGVDLHAFPNPNHVDTISQCVALVSRDARGFAQAGAVYFSLDADLGDPALPDVAASTRAEAPAFLFDLDRRTRSPAVVRYAADGGPFGAPHLLSLLPYQGSPLAPGRHAAVIRRTLADGAGHRLEPSATVAQLASGRQPAGMSRAVFDEYAGALATLAGAGVAAGDIAGLSVFTVDAPEGAMARFLDDALGRPLPVPNAPFTRGEVFDGYCVYSTTIDLPDYQQGAPPYLHSGGDWQVAADGSPVPPRVERARIVITVPRATMPVAGFPTVILVRTGAGGDRPLVDRGAEAMTGGPALAAGSGPAQEFARVGFAGVQVDGPLGGLRNMGFGDEQFLLFNVSNLAALRDNVRESALELVVLAHVLWALEVPAGDCPGAPVSARFDATKLALFGHSMGATIAPLAVALEPSIRAVILSGAGGSYIENILWKRKPLSILPLAETLLDYVMDGRALTEGDPALTMFQWATEPADPQVYGRLVLRERPAAAPPRHVLMEQGIVDNYILPDIANALSLPLGLDLGGAALDRGNHALDGQTSILDALPLAGRRQVALPASGNLVLGGVASTALLVQHAEDGIEDGHEIIFQTAAPKREYRCLLQGFADGVTPVVPAGGPDDAPCN